ncbi:MAG: hypothetical protein WC946_09145 [Bacteroidales bacterium]|nr:hypothetical protein [Patescibacteria group bacterium]
MINKIKLFVIFLVINPYIFLGCYSHKFAYIPEENTTFGCPFYDSLGCIPINPTDTLLVKNRSETNLYTICDIKKQNNVYRIKVEIDTLISYNFNHDSNLTTKYYRPTYEVFSLKTKKIKEFEKLKKGNKYKMTLNPYFLHDILADFKVRGVYIQDQYFGISTGKTNIYTSPNVYGLYYIPNNKNNYSKNYTVDTNYYYLPELIIHNESFLYDLDSFIFKTDYCDKNVEDVYVMDISLKKEYVYEIQIFNISSQNQKEYIEDAKGFFIMNNYKFFVNGILPDNPRTLFSITNKKTQFICLEKIYPIQENQNYFVINIFDPCITVLEYRYGKLYCW